MTCKIALASLGFFFSTAIALLVGSTSNSILRRAASCFTSSMIGNAPVPVPITGRRHFQGISSSMDSGVCPKASRNFLDDFFLRLRIGACLVKEEILPRDRGPQFVWTSGISGWNGARLKAKTTAPES